MSVKRAVNIGKRGQIKPHSAKPAKIRKSSFGTLDTIRTILELQAGSLRIKKLTLKINPKLKFRPTIHIYLQAPPGSMKSTLANKIKEEFKVEVYSNTTLAGLVGGVIGKKTRPGHAWVCRKKPLILDEFDFRERSEIQRAILQILDPGEYTRNLYCNLSKSYVRWDGNLVFKVNRKGLSLRTRVAGVLLTMRDFSKIDSVFHEALLDRCIPIKFSPDKDDLDYIMDTGFYFDPNKYKPSEEIIINKSDYRHIRRYVKKRVPTRHYVRSFNDCLRAYAVTGKFNFALYDLICKLKINEGEL